MSTLNNQKPLILDDEKERQQALNIKNSYIVTSPAGSGKTELLTKRMLKLLCVCDEPENILAVSYTRKAAAEMRNRIIGLLVRAKHKDKAKNDYDRQILELAGEVLARDKQRAWCLLDRPARLQMSTMDAFFIDVCEKMPIACGLGGVSNLVVGIDLEQIQREAVHTMFMDLEGTDARLKADMKTIMSSSEVSWMQIEELFIEILDDRGQWLTYTSQFTQSDKPAEVALAEVRRAIASYVSAGALDLLKPYLDRLLKLAQSAAANLKREAMDEHPNARLIITLAEFSSYPKDEPDKQTIFWQGVRTLLLTSAGAWRKAQGFNKKLGFPSGDVGTKQKEDMRELMAVLEECDVSKINLTRYMATDSEEELSQEADYLLALSRCLWRTKDYLEELFAKRKQIDYTGVKLAALRAVETIKAPDQIKECLGKDIRHILVDEFQDTSPLELQLFSQLTRGWAQYNKDKPENPRTIFLVGDPMQSCYLFRGTDIRLFLHVRRNGMGEIKVTDLRLRSNFRSSPQLVDWANDSFEPLFPAPEDLVRGTTPFVSSVHTRSKSATSSVNCNLIVFNKEKNQSIKDARQYEAELVAQWAEEASKTSTGSIAIMAPTRKGLEFIVPALSAKGLNWTAEQIKSMGESCAVRDLCVLTRVLMDTKDRIAWLSLLRTPWCGIDHSALLALAKEKSNIWQAISAVETIDISDDQRARVQRIRDVLKNSLHMRARCSLRHWVEGAWLALGGPAALDSKDELLNAYAYLNLLDGMDNTQTLSPKRLEQAVGRLFASVGSGEESIKLMTIHAAKGLEFDTVIVAGLDRKSRPDSDGILHWDQQALLSGTESKLLVAAKKSHACTNPIYEWISYVQKERSSGEKRRLLYIAATRAIDRLYMSGCAEQSAKHDGPVCGSYLKHLYDANPALFKSREIQYADTEERVSNNNQRGDLVYLSNDWQLPLVDKSMSVASSTPVDNISFLTGAVPIFDEQRYRHAQVGTTIHKGFERIAEEGLDQWSPDIVAKQSDYWRAHLRQQGVPIDELEDCVQEVIKHLQHTLKDERGRWVLEAHPMATTEMRVFSNKEAPMSLLIVDRSFVIDGERWIVDYKSSKIREGESEAGFIKREEKEHQAQLIKYAEALSALGQEKIRTALYFSCLPKFHEYQWRE